MTSADGDTTIAFNGEIYNQAELQAELSSLGHAFRTDSDTEVVLHAFRQWDTGCFARLRGMFGVALWTESGRRLVLARDRLGIKPLYIHRRAEDLFFGSEMKVILAHPQVERVLDTLALEDYLSLNYVPGPRTLIQGIEKLSPGHWLEWRDGRVQTAAYWNLEQNIDRRWNLEDAKQELDRLMSASVREHLISDVPLGVWASGGLDSSAIVHYAAANSGSQLKTFSISFAGRSFDEGRHFREIASIYGTDHHEFDLNPGVDLADAIQEMVYYADEPVADSGSLPVWYLSKLSGRHVTVALSGEGADELFGGYLAYRADALARRFALAPRFARRLALRLLDKWPVSDDKVGLEYKVKRFVEGSLLDPDTAHCFWYGGLSPAGRQLLMPSAGPGGVGHLFAAHPARWQPDRLHRYLWFDQAYYLPDDILAKCDRMSMAHSVEVRPPFLDHRIVEFAASLPAHLKIRGSAQKYVLRQLMQDRLPHSILKRRKEGFDIPAQDWLRGVLRPLLLDTLTPEAVADAQVFEAGRIESMIASHLGLRKNLGVQLWALLILFLWIRRWNVQCGPAKQTEDVVGSVLRIPMS